MFQATANMIDDTAAGDSSPDGPHFLQLRWKSITSSVNPGIYQEPNYTDEYSTADDVIEGNIYYGGGGHPTVMNTSFLFSKTNVKRGSYVLWFESKHFKNTNIVDRTYGTILTDQLYTSPTTPASTNDGTKIPAINFIFDKAQAFNNNNELEQWIWPYSESISTTIYATKPIKQGIMFAATASVSFRSSPAPHYDYIGQLFGGGFGRVYAVPFLVDAASVSSGYCRALFTYISGSKSLTADFTASTAGTNIGDTIVAYSGSLPGVAKSWALTFNPFGLSLSTIPIRTDISSSWVATV